MQDSLLFRKFVNPRVVIPGDLWLLLVKMLVPQETPSKYARADIQTKHSCKNIVKNTQGHFGI